MEKYPKSGLFYDAKFSLGSAYRQTGSLTNAMLALSDVFKYADKPVIINKASVELGAIQVELGDRQGALASYLRVALLADPEQPRAPAAGGAEPDFRHQPGHGDEEVRGRPGQL